MSIKDNFPSVGPSLSLNFARSKTLDPRITFSRTSSSGDATYTDANGLIITAADDEPRFDHKIENGVVKSLGLLVEEQRTNLVINNEDLSLWKQNSNPTLNSNDTVSPDGNTTADKLTQTTQVYTGVSTDMSGITTNTVYSCSVFIKPDGDTRTRFGFYDTSNWQGSLDTDWSSGEPSTNGSLGGASDIVYEEYPNGWYRASFKASTQSNAFAGTVAFYCHPDRTGTGKSAWFWGAQLEEGEFLTSYIPTSGSTATRSPDNVSMTGTNFSDFYNQDEGTVYVSQKLKAVQDTARNNLVYRINGGGGSDYLYNTKSGDKNIFVFGDGGTNYSRFQVGTDSTDTKTAWAYDVSGDDFKPYYNGIEVTNETDNNTPSATSHTQLELGASSGAKYCGHIQQFAYYPKRLTNTQLQNLTK